MAFTKERLIALSNRENVGAVLGDEIAELAHIALASLEVKAVGYVDAEYAELLKSGHIESCSLYAEQGDGCIALYTAPHSPVSVPEWTNEQCMEFLSIAFRHAEINGDLQLDDIRLGVKMVNGSRAAMLQGADTELQRKAAIHDALCEKYNVESLTDFVDWQRNHIAELEAAPPAPVGEGETAVMPDYPGYALTQRECFQAGKKTGLTEAGNAPVIPDGWVMVPVEPTYQMCEAMGLPWEGPRFPDRYKSMLAAAPQQEAK